MQRFLTSRTLDSKLLDVIEIKLSEMDFDHYDEDTVASDGDSSNVSAEELFDDVDESEDEDGVPDDLIYPELVIDPKSINPKTKKRWTKKELNDAYKNHVESRWSEDMSPAPHEPFTYTAASPGPVGTEIDALSIFQRFFDSRLVEHLVDCSNAYARSSRYKKRRQRDGAYSRELTVADLYLWIAVNLLCVIHGKLYIKDSWSRDVHLRCPIFSSIMSQDRYHLFQP
jgi:hypothetical protein